MNIGVFSAAPSLPLPLPFQLNGRLNKHNNNSCQTIAYHSSSKSFVALCTPSPTSSPVIEDDPSSSSSSIQNKSALVNGDGGGCKACGRQEIEKGCNGEGRMQGGIATVPGFGWWPIKAYRPCPGFVASGGRYRRYGQSMDEVAFGRGPTPTDSNPISSKKQAPNKSKR
ncbi:hypothetical protein PIB30_015365 [Stylosanthes scabra]|uniref:Uncharacterized protein n=1 Tax=Stylosanthes scabra TaxID=79078 RepID=A0ABU6S6U1_9FABA|nr:hypothetical protein [Stylosanthes scabra]